MPCEATCQGSTGHCSAMAATGPGHGQGALGAGPGTLGAPGLRPWLGLKRPLPVAWHRHRHRAALAGASLACGMATYF